MRLIDADALKELLIENLEKIKKNPTMTGQEVHIICASHMLGDMINDAKTIDAVPVVHARWNEKHACTRCTHTVYVEGKKGGIWLESPYCPNCGVRMDGDQDDEP